MDCEKELEHHQEDARDKFFEAQFALWNVLLTVNGITLAVFGVLCTLSSNCGSPFVSSLIVACMVSVCLLVFNFVARKYTHERIYKFMRGAKPPTDDTRKQDLQDTLWRYWSIRFSETASIILFVVEVLLIAAFLLTIHH